MRYPFATDDAALAEIAPLLNVNLGRLAGVVLGSVGAGLRFARRAGRRGANCQSRGDEAELYAEWHRICYAVKPELSRDDLQALP